MTLTEDHMTLQWSHDGLNDSSGMLKLTTTYEGPSSSSLASSSLQS